MPRFALRHGLTLALVVSCVSPASGQSLTASLGSVAPDSRVRVDLVTPDGSRFGRERAQPIVGRLVGVRADTVLLAVRPGAQPLRLPRAAIRGVYLSGGRSPRWRSALQSAIVPALVGGVLSAISAAISRNDDPSPSQAAASGAAWAAVTNGVLGAWSPKERWRRISLPPVAAAETGARADTNGTLDRLVMPPDTGVEH